MEPFQIVRIGGHSKSSRDLGISGLAGAFLPRTVHSNGNAGRPRHAARGAGSAAAHDPAPLAGRGRGERTKPAYLVERDGGWEPVSWTEAATAVEELANGLLALGVRKGDAFGILGQTSLEWALFDFALAHVGAIGAAIYANSAAKDCEYILDHSESVGVLVEDDEQLAKLDDYRTRNPRLEHVLTYADLDDLRARGREYAAAHPGELAEATAAVSPDDVFTYIYTSGTTGPPKACMIRHRNYYAMAAVVDEIDDFTMSDDTMLLYLPLAHNFGRLMHLQGRTSGFTLAFLPDPLRAAEALKAVKPTLFPSVPRVFEKVHTAVLAKFDEETGAKRKIVDWALGVGRRRRSGARRGSRSARCWARSTASPTGSSTRR